MFNLRDVRNMGMLLGYKVSPEVTRIEKMTFGDMSKFINYFREEYPDQVESMIEQMETLARDFLDVNIREESWKQFQLRQAIREPEEKSFQAWRWGEYETRINASKTNPA